MADSPKTNKDKRNSESELINVLGIVYDHGRKTELADEDEGEKK